MVTCKVDSQTAVAVPKMNSVRTRGKPPAAGSNSNSNSSGFRLLDGDQLENNSSVSRNSIYKLKIDLMFDDSRWVTDLMVSVIVSGWNLVIGSKLPGEVCFGGPLASLSISKQNKSISLSFPQLTTQHFRSRNRDSPDTDTDTKTSFKRYFVYRLAFP